MAIFFNFALEALKHDKEEVLALTAPLLHGFNMQYVSNNDLKNRVVVFDTVKQFGYGYFLKYVSSRELQNDKKNSLL